MSNNKLISHSKKKTFLKATLFWVRGPGISKTTNENQLMWKMRNFVLGRLFKRLLAESRTAKENIISTFQQNKKNRVEDSKTIYEEQIKKILLNYWHSYLKTIGEHENFWRHYLQYFTKKMAEIILRANHLRCIACWASDAPSTFSNRI